ncbi:MAG: ABC transporter permease subunit, partial [Actinomycetota bacterium]
MDCSFNLVGPTFVTGMILGFLYALIALGYTMVYGVLRLINFAHDAVFMVGGVAVYYIMGQVLGFATPQAGVGLVTAVMGFLLVGALASAGGASMLEYSVYRPLRRRNAARLSFLIGAIGASFFVTYL